MSREINRSRQALIDVIDIAYYIADKRSLNASDKFLKTTEDTYKQLAEMPGLGVLRDYDNPVYAGMRMWPVHQFSKYLIFYRVTDEEIEIVRVFHSAQDIQGYFAPEELDEVDDEE